jgi:hypothetical protein
MPDLPERLKLFRAVKIYFWKVAAICAKLFVR